MLMTMILYSGICISLLEHKSIARAILPSANLQVDFEDAISLSKSYAMISTNEGEDVFNMHRLLHLGAQEWRERHADARKVCARTVKHLNEIHPAGDYEIRAEWSLYLPHVRLILSDSGSCSSSWLMSQSRWSY